MCPDCTSQAHRGTQESLWSLRIDLALVEVIPTNNSEARTINLRIWRCLLEWASATKIKNRWWTWNKGLRHPKEAMQIRSLNYTESSNWSVYSRHGVRQGLIWTDLKKVKIIELSNQIVLQNRKMNKQLWPMEPNVSKNWPSVSSTQTFAGVSAVKLMARWWQT